MNWRRALTRSAALAMVFLAAHAWAQGSAEELPALKSRADQLYQEGRYSQAIDVGLQILSIQEKALGPEHPDLVTSLNNVGALCRLDGRYEQALQWHRRALALSEKVIGAETRQTAASLNGLGAVYYATGRYAEALPAFERALAIQEKVLGPDRPEIATSLNNIALIYRTTGRYAQALAAGQRVVAIREQLLGPDHRDTAAALNALANVHAGMGRYAEALALYQRALAIRDKALGPDHPETALSLSDLASLYRSLGRYADALPLAQRALEIQQKTLGPDHPATATSLNNLALLHEQTGHYAQALALYQRALDISEKTLGAEHPETTTSLANLAHLHETLGQYEQALALFQRAVALMEKAYGPDHPNLATALNNQAGLYLSMARYSAALPLYERALAIDETALGPDHPDTAATLGNLAQLHGETGHYEAAFTLYRRVLAIHTKGHGDDAPATATTLNNIGELYREMGLYEQAQPLLERALAIAEKMLGPEHPTTAERLNNVGELQRANGRPERALPLAQRAFAITEQAFGPDHPHTALRLSNLASVYENMAQYGKARPLALRALAIRGKALGPDHPDTATSLSNLAASYAATGQYGEAQSLLERSLRVRQASLGPDHPDTANSLGNLAAVHEIIGQYDKAIELEQRALAIRERAFGTGHPEVARSLNNLAVRYEATGRYAEALPLYERALTIRRDELRPGHPDTALTMSNVAMLLASLGEHDKALALYRQALLLAQSSNATSVLWIVAGNLMALHAPDSEAPQRLRSARLAIWYGKQAVDTLQAVRAGLRSLDAQARRGFLHSKEWYYTKLADLLVQEGRIDEAEQVLALLKERELSELIPREGARDSRLAQTEAEQALSRQNAEFGERAQRLAAEMLDLDARRRLQSLTAGELARRRQLDDAIRALAQEHERWAAGLAPALAQDGANAAAIVAGQGTRLQSLLRAEPGAVGLHYIVTDRRIAIIVVTGESVSGRFSDVKMEDLNRQIDGLRRAIVARSDVMSSARALHRMLIEPVADVLASAQGQTVLLSLTGTLRYVPFAALHDGKSFLIERHPLAMHASAGAARPQASRAAWDVAGLGVTQSRLGFAALPGVRTELQGIVRTGPGGSGVLPGRIALDGEFDRSRLEEALKGQYGVVHIASHFSLAPTDESRSILLTGAGEPLTLGQLAALDFSRVQQLTLSACETGTGSGLGENGAEVEGLAAAVQARGAQAVIASLWSLADASTAVLMPAFYAQRAQAEPPSRAKALQQAQLALLRGTQTAAASDATVERSASRPGVDTAPKAAVDPRRPWSHPFYWAPFVLSGNWL